MKIRLLVNSVETIKSKKDGRAWPKVYGLEVASSDEPSTLRQVVGYMVGQAQRVPQVGERIAVSVREIAVFNGRVDVRGEMEPIAIGPSGGAAPVTVVGAGPVGKRV